jgi:hypothetical protein
VDAKAKALKILADETVGAIQSHTQRALAPITAKLDAHAAVQGALMGEISALERRLEALESRLAEVEAKSAGIRRVA